MIVIFIIGIVETTFIHCIIKFKTFKTKSKQLVVIMKEVSCLVYLSILIVIQEKHALLIS